MNRALKIISVILWALGMSAILIFYWMQGHEGYLLYILFFVLSFLTASGVHELGHAFFGLISGVGTKFSFKSLLPTILPSSVQLVPRRAGGLKARLIITALGGLVFNLLFIILGVLALTVPQIPTWLSAISAYHIGLFLDNALCIEYATGKTDGLVISGLLKNTPESQVMLAVMCAQAQILGGKPVGQLDRSLLFDLPQIREDDPAFISLCELRAEYLKATGDEEGAKEQLQRFEELKSDYID